MATTPPATRAFESGLRTLARLSYKGPVLVGPLIMECVFTLERPKSIPKSRVLPSVKPDLDNLLKAVKDALEGTYFVNDSQIVTLNVRKVYGPRGAISVKIGETDDGLLFRYNGSPKGDE
jgi:Holliday junction resolvase RusA-like endonuclease